MFCIMLTGSPSATGSAAPAAVKSLVEQPGRAATGEWHGDGPSPCHSRLRSGSAATLADFTSASAPEASRGHAFAVGKRETGYRTLAESYLRATVCAACKGKRSGRVGATCVRS